MAQIIIDSSNNLIQGDFDNATVNNRTKFKTTTLNGTTNVYAVPNGSSTSAGYSVSNNADPTNASKITIATNGATDTQIISGINGTGSYLPLSFYTNNALAMQITTAGNIVVASTAAPAFSAYLNANQSISNVTVTKVQCNTETFDTNSNYNNATYTFTPTVAGYYQVIASLRDQTGAATGSVRAIIYKNGTDYAASVTPMTTNANTSTCSVLISMNGSTDYLEFYCYQNSGSSINIQGNSYWTYFNAFLARSA